MFRNYLAAALRNLARNRLYATISVLGLGIGLCAALLIALYVRDEFSFESFRPEHARTYLVSEVIEIAGANPIAVAASPAELAAWALADVPQIEAITRLFPQSTSVRSGAGDYNEDIMWADSNVFDVMPMPAIAGDPIAALVQPDGVVLTRSAARKYFGHDTPLDETIEIGRQQVLRVRAVIEDSPPNTHLDLTIVAAGHAAGSPLAARDAQPAPLLSGGNAANVLTYMRLRPGAQPEDVQRAMEAGVARRMPASGVVKVKFPVTRIVDVHLRPELGSGLTRPASSRTTVNMLLAVAGLIVLVAVINLVNLVTARSMRRATEVGVRKLAGATRSQLVLQFTAEALLYVLAGTVLAVALVELLLPWFNGFVDRDIGFPYWSDPVLGGGLLATVLVLGLATGFYPAMALSAYRPAAIVSRHGASPRASSGLARHVLVACQFAVLIGLVIATAVIYRQTQYALHQGLRLQHDAVVLVGGACREGFRHAVAELPGVQAVGCSTVAPSVQFDTQSTVKLDDGSDVLLWFGAADPGYFPLYGMAPVAGRFFDAGRAGDRVEDQASATRVRMVVNETAVRKLRFASAEAAIGETVDCGSSSQRVDCEIIGVAPDQVIDSVRRPVEPSAWSWFPERMRLVSVRIDGQALPETLAAIDRLWRELGEPRPILRSFLSQRVQAQYVDVIRQGSLLAAFSGVAVLIAALGLFGLSAFMAERRTKEIGIRKALGANTGDVLRLLLWQFSRPVVWANLIAWPAAGYLMHRWLAGFAYRIDLPVWLFPLAALMALAIALATVMAQSLAVARSKPVAALRHE